MKNGKQVMVLLVFIAAACLLVAGFSRLEEYPARRASGAPARLAWWVWQADWPDAPGVGPTLRNAGVSEIYRHTATVYRDGESWQVLERWGSHGFPDPPSPDIAFVVRIGGRGGGWLIDTKEKKELAALIGNIVKRDMRTVTSRGINVRKLQLDFDCPTSKLKEYAALLDMLRVELPAGMAVEITALPTWINSVDLPPLMNAVDSATVMFFANSEPLLSDAGRYGYNATHMEARAARWLNRYPHVGIGLADFAGGVVFVPRRQALVGWTDAGFDATAGMRKTRTWSSAGWEKWTEWKEPERAGEATAGNSEPVVWSAESDPAGIARFADSTAAPFVTIFSLSDTDRALLIAGMRETGD